MKNYVFNLLTLSVFAIALLVGCGQNDPSANANGTPNTGDVQQPIVDNNPPSKELIAQMEADIAQFQAKIPEFQSNHDAMMEIRKSLKPTFESLSPATREKLMATYERATAITRAYNELRASLGNLISLSADCTAGKKNAGQAQTEYDNLKKSLAQNMEILTKAKDEAPVLKAEVDNVLVGNNKRAAGGN